MDLHIVFLFFYYSVIFKPLSNSYDGWVGLFLARRNLETKEIREFETGTGIVPHSTEESYRLFGS